MFRGFGLLLCGLLAVAFAQLAARPAQAQQSWVQIEARPTLAEAQARAAEFARSLPGVEGYRLKNGWFAIAIGPLSRAEAGRRLSLLLDQGAIPPDSFIANGNGYTRRFWPDGSAAAAEGSAPLAEAATDDPAAQDLQILDKPETEAGAAPLPQTIDDPAETAEAARADEATLDQAALEDIQRALTFAGLYHSPIDGRFGRGTRSAISEWQAQNGAAPIGYLTARQRAALIQPWQAEESAVGMVPVTEPEAGISTSLPFGLVEFDRYDPPFVRYRARGNSGFEILLISSPGTDDAALAVLGARIAALGLIPPGGTNAIRNGTLAISGQDAATMGIAEARVSGEATKGFLISGPVDQELRLTRVAAAISANFTALDDAVLDENMGLPSTVSAEDLTQGIDERMPDLAQSGLYLDGSGRVLTSLSGLKGCGNLLIDRRHSASIVWSDEAEGIAVLAPDDRLAPIRVARLAAALPAAPAELTIGGYPYGDRLSAPVVTTAALVETVGLDGEANRARLVFPAKEGDSGSAVLDRSGAVIGLVLPRSDDGGRALPADTSFMVPAPVLMRALNATEFAPSAAPAQSTSLAPEDLAAEARGLAALVTCVR